MPYGNMPTGFNRSGNVIDKFSCRPQTRFFAKIRPMRVVLFHTDRWTDKTRLPVGFRFANGYKDFSLFLISSFRRVLYVVCFLLGNYPKESTQLLTLPTKVLSHVTRTINSRYFFYCIHRLVCIMLRTGPDRDLWTSRAA